MASPGRPRYSPPMLASQNHRKEDTMHSVVTETQELERPVKNNRRNAVTIDLSDLVGEQNISWKTTQAVPPPELSAQASASPNLPLAPEQTISCRLPLTSKLSAPPVLQSSKALILIASGLPSIELVAASFRPIAPSYSSLTRSAPVNPTSTVQANLSTVRETYTAVGPVISSPVPLPESSARVDIEPLPSINQDAPRPEEAPKATPPVWSNVPKDPPTPQAILTVNKPMPGKNQPKPTMDEAAASSFMVLNNINPKPTASAPVDAAQAPTLTEPAIPSSSPLIPVPTLPVAPSSSSLTISATPQTPPLSSFLTLTRTEQEKEEAPVTFEISTTTQAITAAQLISAAISSTLPVSSFMAISTATPSSSAIKGAQQKSGLTPQLRTLLIVFGVLGALVILIALAVILPKRSNQKRSQARIDPPSDNPFDNPNVQSHFSVTTYITATNSVDSNNSLTESEKAIVTRATSPDGEHNSILANPGSKIANAINAFIAKSRRLTYKITP